MTHSLIEDVPKTQITDPNDQSKIHYQWELWFSRLIGSLPRLFSVTFDPASVAANTSAEQTVTVQGISLSDIVVLNKPTLTVGLGIGGVRVSATNTLSITFINLTGSAIDPPSEKYTGYAVRS